MGYAARTIATGLCVGLGLGLPATPAHATSFHGNCQVVGDGGFAAGAGYLPAANTWWMEGRGGCTGELDGVQVVDHPVRLKVEFDDPLAGCAASLTTGDGSLVFKAKKRRGKTLRFTQTQAGPGARVAGATAGMGLAYLTAYTQLARQDPNAIPNCASGSLTWFAAEWAMKTLTPLQG